MALSQRESDRAIRPIDEPDAGFTIDGHPLQVEAGVLE